MKNEISEKVSRDLSDYIYNKYLKDNSLREYSKDLNKKFLDLLLPEINKMIEIVLNEKFFKHNKLK